MPNIPFWGTSQFKNLIIETSRVLQQHLTFREIADLFYRGGIIEKPENPWPAFQGTKYDYALERLAGAKDVRVFFREILPELFAGIDMEYSESSTASLVWAAKKVGYKINKIEEVQGIPDHDEIWVEYRVLVPPKELAEIAESIVDKQEYISTTSIFPSHINKLLGQMNIAVSNECWDAAALLIRRIIFLASVISAKQNNYHDKLLKDRDYIELSSILGAVSRNNPDINAQLLSRIQAAKWMGDYANHLKNWKASETEVQVSLVSLRAFLFALFNSDITN